jgi:hypothetical protein
MQLGNAVAARVNAEKGEQGMYETASSPEQHAEAKRARGAQVLQIGLAYRSRMAREQPQVFHMAPTDLGRHGYAAGRAMQVIIERCSWARAAGVVYSGVGGLGRRNH